MPPAPSIQTLFQSLKDRAAARPGPPLAERIRDLDRLEHAIRRQTDALLRALADDLGKPAAEAYASEIGFVLRDLAFARRNLRKWMKPRRARVPWFARPGRAAVHRDLLGCVLIIGPWNYPLQLLLSPFIGALAAGNTVCLKPSEFAPATADAVARICAECFPPEQVAVVRGDAAVAAGLCRLPFHHIFFTGSTPTGRQVAAAAAANLVPVTLELGGKSPCVVCADAPPAAAARRILWGKCLNAGQTCVAPDFVLAHTSIVDSLLAALRDAAEAFVPSLEAPAYGRILNERHFDRLLGLMRGQPVWAGGASDRARLKIGPTLLYPVAWEAPVMQEEIFGPLLPVLPFTDLDAALDRLNGMPRPLAAYLFTRDSSAGQTFLRRMPAGGICINDTILQIMPADLPFGGVGASGHGRYRGRAGFECFSNPKAVLQRPWRPDPAFRAPGRKISMAMLKRTYHWLMG